jgi:hypothetical protein
MIELLDEISEIPFEVFWEKWQDLKPSICDRSRAEMEWFYMHENDRVTAFTALCRNHPCVKEFNEAYQFLRFFNLPL